jgi:two-component system, OmpR family, sensor kinase
MADNRAMDGTWVQIGHVVFFVAGLNVTNHHMERDIERLDILTGETLQLSRLSGTVSTFVNERVELGGLVSEIVRDARLERSASEKSVSSRAVEDLCVYGNAELIRRAVENVMRSAVRFEPAGDTVSVLADGDDRMRRRCLDGDWWAK